jgi:phosphatidylinositol N-acetylglucosaminyltransferase subunit H
MAKQHTKPLETKNPELFAFEAPGCKEYRVENWRLARDGSGKIIHGYSSFPWAFSVATLVAGLIWDKVTRFRWIFSRALSQAIVFALVFCSYTIHSQSCGALRAMGTLYASNIW